MIDRTLDSLLPTSEQPAPAMETAGDRDVLLARGAAAAIDLTGCYVFLELPVVYVLGELFPGPYEALGTAAAWLSILALLPLYASYKFVLEYHYGRTPGKVNRGLLVVMSDGRQVTYRASALRNLFVYVDVLGVPPLVVGLVAALAFDGRRVGDRVAGTVVVRSTAPDTAGAVVSGDVETDAAARAPAERETGERNGTSTAGRNEETG